MTHEIEIIISHFSRPLKPLSVIFMAYGIYNTPTFPGSWTLVPDISWQFHESWKPLSTFHRKFMAWKIGHENEISVFRALKNAFLGFFMTFSWDFHNIAVHSVMELSSALLICNVNLIPINTPINSNRGILMAFSGAYLEFAATNCILSVPSSYSCRAYVTAA